MFRKYLNKKDLKTFFKYGYMEFDLKQAMFYYFVFDLPCVVLLTFLFKFLLG